MATKTQIDPRITTNPEGLNEPKTKRNREMVAKHDQGLGINSLAREYDLSPTRVRQILDHEAKRK